MKDYFEEKSEKIYSGEVISLFKDIVRFPDGKSHVREVIKHRGAAGVIAIGNGQVYLVKQYRHPIKKGLLEIPAGLLSKDEEPKMCAERELKEETGLTAARMIELTSFYTTPGCSDEIFHLFLALDLTEGEPEEEDDEFLELVKIPFKEALAMVMNREIQDSKTLIGILMTWKYLLDNDLMD